MTATRKVKHYGWRRDLPDPRDYIYNLRNVILDRTQVPPMVDLEAEMPPVYDQLQLGSCTANGVAAVVEHREMQEGQSADTPSRLFIYYGERVIEGSVDSDSGAEVRDGIKVVVQQGAPPEELWPYSDSDPGPFQQKPPQDVYSAAIKHEALQYQRIVVGGPGAPMRTAIKNGLPIVFGLPVPDYFEQGWDPSTPLPLPTSSTNWIGGHCMVVVGYDFSETRFNRPAFKVRNSWSSSWGENGHCWLDYEWFSPNSGLADDLWVIMKVS